MESGCAIRVHNHSQSQDLLDFYKRSRLQYRFSNWENFKFWQKNKTPFETRSIAYALCRFKTAEIIHGTDFSLPFRREIYAPINIFLSTFLNYAYNHTVIFYKYPLKNLIQKNIYKKSRFTGEMLTDRLPGETIRE